MCSRQYAIPNLPPELKFLLFLCSVGLLLLRGREGAFGFGWEGAAVPFPNDRFLGGPSLVELAVLPFCVFPPIFVKEEDFSFMEAINCGPALPNIEIPPTTPFG